MKVQKLRFSNFTAFHDAVFDFCPGVNVLIGVNATGKSHVLKAAYALQKAWDDAVRSNNGSLAGRKESGHLRIAKLASVFRPDTISDLIRNNSKSEKAEVELVAESGTVRLTIRRAGMTPLPNLQKPAPCLYLPPRDVLAIFDGFIAAYHNRELAFDETYYDLCIALSAAALREAAWAESAIDRLQRELHGTVRLKRGRFYVGKLQAQLVAEGLRKVAQLVQLLRNGSISAQTTLYWDEPESGLNPRLSRKMADVILALAGCGVQVILASHDFLLTSELSLYAERDDGTSFPIRFFALSRSRTTDPVDVETAETLSELRHNPILEEFAAYYDRQQALFVDA